MASGGSSGMNTTNLAVVTGCLGGASFLMLIGVIFLLREKGWCCFRSRSVPVRHMMPELSREERGELRLIEEDNEYPDTTHNKSSLMPAQGGPQQQQQQQQQQQRNSRLITHSARRRELERASHQHYEAAGVAVGPGAHSSLGPQLPPTPHTYGSNTQTLLDMAAAAAASTPQLSVSGSGPLGLQPLALNCLQVSQVPPDYYLPAPDMGDLTRGSAMSILKWRDSVTEVMQRVALSGDSLGSPVPDDPWYDQHRTVVQSPRPSDHRSETMSVASSQDPFYAGVTGNLRSPVVSELSDVPGQPLLLVKQHNTLEGEGANDAGNQGDDIPKDADSVVLGPAPGDDI